MQQISGIIAPLAIAGHLNRHSRLNSLLGMIARIKKLRQGQSRDLSLEPKFEPDQEEMSQNAQGHMMMPPNSSLPKAKSIGSVDFLAASFRNDRSCKYFRSYSVSPVVETKGYKSKSLSNTQGSLCGSSLT